MPQYIHGETDAEETARLETQAPFAASFSLQDLHLQPGRRILDLACGVGAMTSQLARYFPGHPLSGLDIERSQLSVATERYSNAGYVQGDGCALPFHAETFGFVHASWMLEHVADPPAVLREVRRVLEPGGICHFTEVENSTFRTEPEYPEVVEVWQAMIETQLAGGARPFQGRDLDRLLREAGFREVTVWPADLKGQPENSYVRQRLSGIFADIISSFDEALGPDMLPTIQAAATRLRAIPSQPGAAVYFSPTLGRGRK